MGEKADRYTTEEFVALVGARVTNCTFHVPDETLLMTVLATLLPGVRLAICRDCRKRLRCSIDQDAIVKRSAHRGDRRG